MNRAMSIRLDENVYAFVNKIAKQEKEEVSQAFRELVKLGRLMLAIQKYKDKKISIGKAAEIAGLSISEMIEVLAQFRIDANLEEEDYAKGLNNLRKAW